MQIRRLAARAGKLCRMLRYLGLGNTARHVGARLYLSPSHLVQFRLREARFPVVARAGGSSDLGVITQVFVHREYAALDDLAPRLIVDCGANVGYASAYFLTRFPEARVVAIEPDPRNVVICRRNLAPYGDRATVLHAAIWSCVTSLTTVIGEFGDGREWATQVREAPPGSATVAAVDIPGVIPPGSRIDLLKIDIEGAECNLFGAGTATWLPLVQNIAIELHGPEAERIFLRALQDFDCTLVRSGTLTICRNLRPRQDTTGGPVAVQEESRRSVGTPPSEVSMP